MDNTKAIDHLNGLIYEHDFDPSVINDDDVEALKMAIEALKNSICPKCGANMRRADT